MYQYIRNPKMAWIGERNSSIFQSGPITGPPPKHIIIDIGPELPNATEEWLDVTLL